MNDQDKQQQLAQRMTTFCHEFRISDKGRAVIGQPIFDARQLQVMKQVLQEADQLLPKINRQAEAEQLNELMEQTRRCLKSLDRQLLMSDAKANIRKATDAISRQYGAQADQVLSARQVYEQSRQQPTTDLSQLDQDGAADD